MQPVRVRPEQRVFNEKPTAAMLCRSKLDLAGSLEGDRINFVQGYSKNARTRVSDQRVVLVGDL